MMRRESGLALISATACAIWSMWRPSAASQARHCLPYTGPSSPCSSAHSSQIVTPCSRSQATLVSPRRNHSSSYTIERRCTFLVVTSGKPAARSKRICWPNSDSVPVPVRSSLRTPAVADAAHELQVLLHCAAAKLPEGVRTR